MADDVSITPGSGVVIASDDVGGGLQVQRVKATWGVDGTATDVSKTAPLPTTDATDGSLVSTAVSVGTTATALPASAASGRKRILIQNLGTGMVYVGSSAVATTTGIEIAPKGTLTLPLGASVLYGRVASGTADVRVLEFV